MKRKLLFIALILLVLLPTASAQRRRKVRKIKEVKQPEVVENPQFLKMLPATAQIVVVDSMVTDKSSVLRAIPVNMEEGKLATAAQFFKTGEEGIVYVNELGNKCIFSKIVDQEGNKQLFQCDKFDDNWSDPIPLQGLDDDGRLTDFDYPYLMPDGVTLYFAARGSESLGGYDIYCTRFDAEEGRFLRPENMGLPFNSEQDDYLFVIDEQNKLAYFASSRNQNNDSVCIYTFVPFETRKMLNAEAYDPQKFRSMARLECIADTWGDGTECREAKDRQMNLYSNYKTAAAQQAFMFILNDKKTYTRMRDFQNPDNRERMKELLYMQRQDKSLLNSLAKARNSYTMSSGANKEELGESILKDENHHQKLLIEIKNLEKTIRMTEFK